MSCGCTGDLRRRLRGLPSRRVAWTDDWAATAPGYRDEDVVFSTQPPPVPRIGRGFAVCACEPGTTRIGGGWVVLYGSDAELPGLYAETVEFAALALRTDPGDGRAVVAVLQALARGSRRCVVAENFRSRGSVVLVAGGNVPRTP